MRRARFKVAGRFDGTAGATVTIEVDGANALMRVRPTARRRTFDLDLGDVARGVIFDVTRAELRRKRASKGAGPGGR